MGVVMSNKVEKKYQEFWKDIIEKDGEIDLEQVKKELSDYSFLLEQVPIVYCEISRQKLSKPHYHAGVLIQELEENFYDAECTKEDVRDMIVNCSDKEELVKELAKYFDIQDELS